MVKVTDAQAPYVQPSLGLVPPVMSTHVVPPSLLLCQRMVRGAPAAEIEKEVFEPSHTTAAEGCYVTVARGWMVITTGSDNGLGQKVGAIPSTLRV